jgi:hypothetical protein
MATVTMAEIQQLIEAAVKGAIAGGRKERGASLDERHFRRVDKLDGRNWKEFAFQYKTAVGSANPKIRNFLEEIQKGGKDPGMDDILLNETLEETARMGAEVFSTLSLLATGEALVVLRGVPSGDGFEAWSKLFNRFDPKTPAKALMAMMAVMNPKKIKDVRELTRAVEDWEVKVKGLKTEHDLELDDQIMVALLTSMLPADMQDYVFQWSDGKCKFPEMRDRIMSMAINRASMSKPVPMEVDKVSAECWEEHYEAEWANDEQEEVAIGYVGEACLRCGGAGHYVRECPTLKGKGKGKSDYGKGEYGKSKGKGKGDYGKGEYGKGKGKGKSKGFGGECWQCGERGHRAYECPKGKSMGIGSVEEEGDEINVGGVWSIGMVKAEPEWTVVQPKGRKKAADGPRALGRQISAVASANPWKPVGKGYITIDSAAEESVCPKAWGGAFPMKTPAKWLKFTNASGGSMNHYGEKEAQFKTSHDGPVMGLGFQVSDVEKPLAAVWRIADKGNIVQFGPRQEDNFIQNVVSHRKIPMHRRGGSYVMEAEFVVPEPGFTRQVVTA